MLTLFASIDWSNPWLVGIGTGVVSGVAVSFIVAKTGRFFWSRKDDRERQQQIETANHEVLYALRPSIAEDAVPSREIVDVLACATARKYKLQRTEMSTLEQYADDLIKEVLDSSFISNQQKLKYCADVTKIKELPRTPTFEYSKIESIEKTTEAAYYNNYRQRTLRQATTIIGMVAGLSTAAFIPLLILQNENKGLESNFMSTIAAASTALVAMLLTVVTKFLYPTNRSHKNGANDDITDRLKEKDHKHD